MVHLIQEEQEAGLAESPGIGTAGSDKGGAGGNPCGAGNPGINERGSYINYCNGTGGLLILYCNSIINNGTIKSNGTKGGEDLYDGSSGNGGSTGGGSINIFYRNTILQGTISAEGGAIAMGRASANNGCGGKGGTGSISIGKIQDGTYISTYTNY